MEHFLLWSIWWSHTKRSLYQYHNQLVTIQADFSLLTMIFRMWFDYNLGLALSLFNMSSKLTQSYEDNLIVENQTNSFLFSNLLNYHHRNDLPFVKGVSIIQIIFQIRIFIESYKAFEFIYIIIHLVPWYKHVLFQ